MLSSTAARAGARAGLFSGVLPICALAREAAIGAGEVSSEQLAVVGVVVLGMTLGMRVAPRDTPQVYASRPAKPHSRAYDSGAAFTSSLGCQDGKFAALLLALVGHVIVEGSCDHAPLGASA